MLTSTLLNYLALSTAALVTASDRRCYRSTTTVPHPALSCTPFAGICPMIICADEARPKATVTVPQNHAALVTECASIPTVTSYGGACVTDCGPVTCPTLIVTKTASREDGCCTARAF